MAKKRTKVKRKRKVNASHNFVSVLAIVSIMGFAAIISDSWFNFRLSSYVEALILLAMGVGFILESEPKILLRSKKGIDQRNFGRLTTFVIGSFATVAGILSFPYINIQHFVFLSIKGLISFIAIIFIIVQTWLTRD